MFLDVSDLLETWAGSWVCVVPQKHNEFFLVLVLENYVDNCVNAPDVAGQVLQHKA